MNQLERPQMILVAMSELSAGSTKPLKYEDIVVQAFTMFPQEFALRGHPQYPDSSDIHKPLYGSLKKAGFVRNANKSFALTERGVDWARKLTAAWKGIVEKPVTDRLDRATEGEIQRIRETAAFRLFAEGKKSEILDTDFFIFLGCTVRTPAPDFIGRLANVENAINEAAQKKRPSELEAAVLKQCWGFLSSQFFSVIEFRRKPSKQ